MYAWQCETDLALFPNSARSMSTMCTSSLDGMDDLPMTVKVRLSEYFLPTSSFLGLGIISSSANLWGYTVFGLKPRTASTDGTSGVSFEFSFFF